VPRLAREDDKEDNIMAITNPTLEAGYYLADLLPSELTRPLGISFDEAADLLKKATAAAKAVDFRLFDEDSCTDQECPGHDDDAVIGFHATSGASRN
jgi:hypothetical protein